MKVDKLVEQARKILTDVGMDGKRPNKRSVLTFLSLAKLDEENS